MTVYKTSFLVTGSTNPGTILNLDHRPIKGEIIQLGDQLFEIQEVFDLMPGRGEFRYLHATCQPTDPPEQTDRPGKSGEETSPFAA